MEMPRFETENSQEQGSEAYLLKLVSDIENISNSEEFSPAEMQERCKPLVRELLEHFETDLHLHLSSEISILYAEMQRKNLLARVESVSKIIECIAAHKPILVGNDESHYANAVTSDPEGLRIALAEADAVGPVRLLVGLDLKALIGFKSDHLEVSEIDDDQFDQRDTGVRKSLCRHVVGEILPEDLECMVLRIPRVYFPEEDLLPHEQEQSTPFIFRGSKVKAFLSEPDILQQKAA
jgi:hypothetical protein